MILADTSIWIDHFHSADPILRNLVEDMKIVLHPFVIGEMACGFIPKRQQVLSELSLFPCLKPASETEVLRLIDIHRVMGKGLGYIDVHLAAAAFLEGVGLWTRDKSLRKLTDTLNVSWSPL